MPLRVIQHYSDWVCTAVMSKWRHERSSRLIRNLSNCEREAWKKFRLQRDSNPWPLRYRCSALPTELWSHNCWEQVNFLYGFPVFILYWIFFRFPVNEIEHFLKYQTEILIKFCVLLFSYQYQISIFRNFHWVVGSKAHRGGSVCKQRTRRPYVHFYKLVVALLKFSVLQNFAISVC